MSYYWTMEKLKNLPTNIAVRAIITNNKQEVMLMKRALGTMKMVNGI